MKNRTKGQSVKPHGLRWPAQCPLRRGPPRTSEHVYTPRVYYNHLLQEKQAFFFEPAAKKKPLLPPSRSERQIQTVSLPQPQNPTTGWLGRKLNGRWQETNCGAEKRFIFSLKQMKGLGTWISQFSNKDQVSDLQSPSHEESQVSWVLDEIKTTVCAACVANLEIWLFYDGFHQVYIYQAINCQAPLVELTPADGFVEVGGIRIRESEEWKRATKTDTKESARQTQTVWNKKKEVLQSLVYIPQPRCLTYPRILNLYNHPLSKSPQTILSTQERGGDIQHRWCQVLPSGDRWSKRTD